MCVTSRHDMTLKKKPFENIMGKVENAGSHHFHLIPQCFLSFPLQLQLLQQIIFLLSANAFNLEQTKILSCGKLFTTQLVPTLIYSAEVVF